MINFLARSWWVLALRGLAGLLFGIAALIWPGETLIFLIALFGAYMFVDGIFSIGAAIQAAERHLSWWALLLEGILGIIVGIIAFVHPISAAVGLLYLIGAWAIVTGVLEIAAAIRLRPGAMEDWLLVLSGIASLIFGILLVIFPGAGLLVVITIVGIYAIIFGVLFLILAFRLRGHAQAAA